MSDNQETVTCTERVRMNALAGLLFIAGGDAIILVAVMSGYGGTGFILMGLMGIAAMLLGFYYMLCFLNKRITLSEDGVTYCNWMGKRIHYDWDEVSVSHHPGRNAYFVFILAGKKVTFYGYARNALAMHEYLYANGRYDNDTMREERRAEAEEAEMLRLIELQEQAEEAIWDEDASDEEDVSRG